MDTAYLKADKTQVGVIIRVYTTDSDQKRMEVRFPHSTVDAVIEDFEIV